MPKTYNVVGAVNGFIQSKRFVQFRSFNLSRCWLRKRTEVSWLIKAIGESINTYSLTIHKVVLTSSILFKSLAYIDINI